MGATKSWLLVVVATATGACLPRGEPPAGRQLIADRAVSLAAMVPPNGDGLLRLLLLRPELGTGSSDLSVVSVDANGELSPERLLVSNIDSAFGAGWTSGVAPSLFDGKGRVRVYRNDPGRPVVYMWVDPVSGEVENASPGETFSDSGRRSFARDFANDPNSGTLYDADGHATPIQLVSPRSPSVVPNRFVGDDFYYLAPDNRLIDVPPSDVPEQVATGVVAFNAWNTPDGVLMILSRATPDSTTMQLTVRDPVTGVETPVPFDSPNVEIVEPSPDGRWLVQNEYSEGSSTFTIFDYRSGTQSTAALPAYAEYEYWRPGTSELWTTAVDSANTPTVCILRPDGPTETVAGVGLFAVGYRGPGTGSPFTPDGSRWFSDAPDPNGGPDIARVGPADDPSGPQTVLNAPETYLSGIWPLADGHYLIVTNTGTRDARRNDVTIVDPQTGDTHLLAERGLLAAIGQTRLIGLFHFDAGSGDLTAIDLDTLRPTVLAPEFTVSAFAEPQGGDLVAPGTRIAYQFQARTASPYDGIWLVNSP